MSRTAYIQRASAAVTVAESVAMRSSRSGWRITRRPVGAVAAGRGVGVGILDDAACGFAQLAGGWRGAQQTIAIPAR